MNKKRAIDSFKQTSELHQTGGRAKLRYNLQWRECGEHRSFAKEPLGKHGDKHPLNDEASNCLKGGNPNLGSKW